MATMTTTPMKPDDELEQILVLARTGYSHQEIARHLGRSQGFVTMRIRRWEQLNNAHIPRVRLKGLPPLSYAPRPVQAPVAWPLDERATGGMISRERAVVEALHACKPWGAIECELGVDYPEILRIRARFERRTGLVLPRRNNWAVKPRPQPTGGSHPTGCACRTCERAREIDAEIRLRRRLDNWERPPLDYYASLRSGEGATEPVGGGW